MWQLWVIDGLAGGQIALAFKMHHAIADGGASVRILEELFGALPLPGPGRDEPTPSRVQLARTALAGQVRLWAGFPRMARRQLASMREAAAMHHDARYGQSAKEERPATAAGRLLWGRVGAEFGRLPNRDGLWARSRGLRGRDSRPRRAVQRVRP